MARQHVHQGKQRIGVLTRRHRAGERRPDLAATWLLAACLLMVSTAQAANQNPFEVINTGSIGASSEPLLPPLSTFVHPSTSFGLQSEVLGSTAFRIVGPATASWLEAAANSSASSEFVTALNQSFSAQYAVFGLGVQLSAPTAAASATTTPSADGTTVAPGFFGFNQNQQFSAVDVLATVSAEANLSATLPGTWLPMAKYAPLLEASMRQRGYEIQILVLNSTVAAPPAELLFPHLPTPNTTAFKFVLNITGNDVTPFDVAKQTALLSALARNFPRLAFGFGLEQAQIVAVLDVAADQTSSATIITESGGYQQLSAERLKLAALETATFISLSGIPCYYAVQSVTAVAGVTLSDQVTVIRNASATIEPVAINPSPSLPAYNVAGLSVSNTTVGRAINSTAPITLGTVWYRLVGVSLAQSNFTADATTVIGSLSQYTTLDAEASPFVQVVTANMSAASVIQRRKLLEPDESQPVDVNFNQYNSFSAVDVNVTLLAGNGSTVPTTWLPLSFWTTFLEEFMRFKGYQQVHWLTLDAALAPSAVGLFSQLPQAQTTAYQVNMTLVGDVGATPIVPLTLAQQTAVLTVIQGLLPATPFGVGPQWGRFQSVQYDVDPTSVSGTNSPASGSDASVRTVNISLLFNCLLPVIYNDASDTFPQLFNYSMDQLSQRLTAAGLGSNLTLTSIAPVSGYTLEAQLRALNGTSAGVNDGTAAPPFSEPAAAPSSESALSPPASATRTAIAGVSASSSGGLSAGAKAGIAGGVVAGFLLGAAALAYANSTARGYIAGCWTSHEAKDKDSHSHTENGKIQEEDTAPVQIVVTNGGDLDPKTIRICKRPDGSDWCLGSGTYGKVYKAVRHGMSEVAVKMVKCVADDASTLQLMRKEIGIMRAVSYDAHIVQFYGACTTTEPAMLVMEYMRGGDLHTAIRNDVMRGTHEFDWHNKGKQVALAVARGLGYLHQNGVVHRDVKPGNILLTEDGHAKVSDMGLSRAEFFSSCHAFAGTFMYAAPEVLLGRPSNEKADAFSYGVVLWELVTKEQTRRGNWRPVRVPEECPAAIEALIVDCLTDDIDRRPSMQEVVQRLVACDRPDADFLEDSAHDTGTGSVPDSGVGSPFDSGSEISTQKESISFLAH